MFGVSAYISVKFAEGFITQVSIIIRLCVRFPSRGLFICVWNDKCGGGRISYE